MFSLIGLLCDRKGLMAKDGELHESWVDCCQMFIPGSQSACLLCTLIPMLVWKSVKLRVFRTSQ